MHVPNASRGEWHIKGEALGEQSPSSWYYFSAPDFSAFGGSAALAHE
jgi:hypothetical protein